MGLFGREKQPEPDPRETALRQARDRYQARRSEYLDKGDSIEATCKQTGRLFAYPTWRMRVEEEAVTFFPEINQHTCDDADALDQAQEVVLPRQTYAFSHPQPARTLLEQEGERQVYARPSFSFTVSGPRAQETPFSVYSLETACRYFTAHPGVLTVRPVFDLFEGEGYGVVEFLRGGPETPAGRQQIWREGDTLYLHRLTGYAGRPSEGITLTAWPLAQIVFYRAQGTVRQEYITKGGELSIDESAFWWPHLSQASLLSDAIQVSPVRTEQRERDERYIELQLTDGRIYRLAHSGLELLRRLMPEKEFGAVPDGSAGASGAHPGFVQGRVPTTVEELAILAGLLDQGHLTQAEFDEAKARLLKKL